MTAAMTFCSQSGGRLRGGAVYRNPLLGAGHAFGYREKHDHGSCVPCLRPPGPMPRCPDLPCCVLLCPAHAHVYMHMSTCRSASCSFGRARSRPSCTIGPSFTAGLSSPCRPISIRLRPGTHAAGPTTTGLSVSNPCIFLLLPGRQRPDYPGLIEHLFIAAEPTTTGLSVSNRAFFFPILPLYLSSTTTHDGGIFSDSGVFSDSDILVTAP